MLEFYFIFCKTSHILKGKSLDTSSLLIEIFTEELPYSAIKKEFGSVLAKFSEILKKYRLDSAESTSNPQKNANLAESSIDFFYTPRRLIFYARNFPLKQYDEVKEFFGPPLDIAYNNNEPTNATKSFLSKLNITPDDLQTKQKNGKECLYFARKDIGQNTRNLLENIIDDFLESLNFDKKMYWGDSQNAFVRPIRNIFALLGDEFIAFKNLADKYKFTQTAMISPHRSFMPKEIKSTKEYFSFLDENAVIYSQFARRERILSQIKQSGLFVEIDEDLLNEIVAICEYPNVLHCEFDAKFLTLPKEVIVTSMKINQKYFATYTNAHFSTLNNAFIVVCNSINPSEIINKGNIKVLSARLEDALFFYQNDIKSFNAKECDARLKNIEFIKNGGSLWDKIVREKAIATAILQNLKRADSNANSAINEAFCDEIISAINISKNDLVSEMVGEFGELQGIMGGYYAKNAALSQNICDALKEQYLPSGTKLPQTLSGGIVGIANKLDSILSLFALDKIPSGSKDPFALRRNASGILKIIEKFNLHLDLGEILPLFEKHYKKIDIVAIQRFFYERLEGVLEVNQSLINAALKSNESDLLELINKIKALNLITQSPDKNDFKILFKRVANILSEVNANAINEELLLESSEKELYDKIIAFQKIHFATHSDRIKELLKFKNILERFFNEVLINVEDKAIKENRILLIKAVYEEFFKVGDIKEISF